MASSASHHAQAFRTATSRSAPCRPSAAHMSTMQIKGGAIASPTARGDMSLRSAQRTCVSTMGVSRVLRNVNSRND